MTNTCVNVQGLFHGIGGVEVILICSCQNMIKEERGEKEALMLRFTNEPKG